MKKIFSSRSFGVTGMLFALIITFCTKFSLAQDYKKIDSLHKKLALTTNDTARVWALHDLAIIYLYSNNDSSARFAQQALVLSRNINYTRGEIRSMNDIGNALSITGSYSSAIEIFLSALEKSENLKDERMKATSLGNLAEAYNEQGDFKQAIRYTTSSLAIDLANHDTLYTIIDYLNLSDYYVKVNMPDSALPYATQAYQLALKVNFIEQMPGIQMN